MESQPTEPGPGGVLQMGRYTLNPWRNVLVIDSREIALSPLAARLLEMLARKPGEIVERRALVDELWRGDWLTGDPALNRVVSEIRKAVSDDPKAPNLIQTIPRRGYRLAVAADGTVGPPPGQIASAMRGGPWMWVAAAVAIVVILTAIKLGTDWMMPVIWASDR